MGSHPVSHAKASSMVATMPADPQFQSAENLLRFFYSPARGGGRRATGLCAGPGPTLLPSHLRARAERLVAPEAARDSVCQSTIIEVHLHRKEQAVMLGDQIVRPRVRGCHALCGSRQSIPRRMTRSSGLGGSVGSSPKDFPRWTCRTWVACSQPVDRDARKPTADFARRAERAMLSYTKQH